MTEQYRPNVGEQPDERAFRDAIHIAVAPLVAAVDLMPGEKFGLDDNGLAWPESWTDRVAIKRVGIVDPFLSNIVARGQRFWGFLFPNTITNLRHVWSHPAFKVKPPEEKTHDGQPSSSV